MGNGGEGGDDKGSSSSGSLGGEGGGGMSSSSTSTGGMNSGGEGGCSEGAKQVSCGDCGTACVYMNQNQEPQCGGGTCRVTCAEHQFDFVPDVPDDQATWGCETLGRRVFVTEQKFVGTMLGGVAAADVECQAAAMNAGLGGAWRAWLSDDTSEPVDDIEQSSDPYYLVDGTKVADDFTHLTSVGLMTELASAINRHENGMLVANGEASVWTGTSPFGLLEPNCNNWSSNVPAAATGVVGDANRKDAGWTKLLMQRPCSSAAHLYCFEQ